MGREPTASVQPALRAITANYPYMLLMNRADIEIGRGRFDAGAGAP